MDNFSIYDVMSFDYKGMDWEQPWQGLGVAGEQEAQKEPATCAQT